MVKESVKVKARISSKGQVTIPKAIRERLGVRPGDDVEFVLEPGGVRVRRDSAAFLGALDHYRGYWKEMEGVDVDEWLDEVRGR